ncbi:hypothetical protein T492DRAFT_868018 [Pavlovales sp. CCMP2436]|nr:hypothetical protein T492DRAFT_868018 [Pavlovales sp. CCMP2436]
MARARLLAAPCCMLLTTLLRLRSAGAGAGGAGRAVFTRAARALAHPPAAARLRMGRSDEAARPTASNTDRRRRTSADSAEVASEQGALPPPVPFPDYAFGLAEFCTECGLRKAPSKLLRSYVGAIVSA